MMLNIHRLVYLLLLLALLPTMLSAQEFPNRYSNMADSLFDMMDAFSSAYQRKLDQQRNDDDHYSYPPMQAAPGYPPPYAASPLDGNWQGQSGELLVIKGALFRIYVNRSNFRQGRISFSGPNQLQLQDQQSGQIRAYEFAQAKGRLVLRDQNQNMLLYRRTRR